ncbi:hypothetical protein CK203_047553 [Vitis vinifera]|uniref:Reverse transcriptase RNase H-like domain-containing protein n=1 Tax=Vitis vinifera TaxID=29760 RepID=A0A438GX05_VITVI|nr:hypothetical protein CK203_047553 [Vitis vinifera]
MGNQRRSIPLSLTQGVETYLLYQQGIGRRRNQIFKMELTALALRSAAQKLRSYFQAHPVIVLTDQPLRNILHKPDLIGRMLQWAIELSEFGIEFQPRLSMKGQVMVDFVLEYSQRPGHHDESNKKEWWTLRVDGASRSSGSGVGLLLQSPIGNIWNKPSSWDSLPLTMKQNMKPSCPDWTSLLLYPSPNSGSTVTHNSWNSTRKSQTGTQSPGASCPFHLNWRAPVQAVLHRTLPSMLRAVRAQYVLAELHEGICGNHSGGQSLAHRAHSQGYYWPTMKKRRGSICQKMNFCSELNIRNSYSTPRYPQSNGQAEATNKTLITALKKRLEQAKGLPTIRTDATKQSDANMELGRNLDWTDEVREGAAIRMADYQQRASAHYNRKVRPRSFKNGMLVLRKVFENTTEVGAGKFQANWE